MNDTPTAAPMREENCTYCKGYGYVIMAPSTTSMGGKEACPQCQGVKAELVAPAAPMHKEVTQENALKWRERWYGSEPQKGSAIVDERGNLIAYFGGDESTHKATTAVVSAHNATLAHTARPDTGNEDVERLAQFLHDEGGFGDAMTDRSWPEHADDTGQREGGWVKIVPPDVQAQFRDVARRWLMPRATAPSPRGFSRFDPPGLWESEPRSTANDAGKVIR
ncbi:YuiA family protein [Sphingomonas sp. CARO-RG-8B-R24-01]|uniref:YuiA family protein n=1 Tax=Sphingomonas sp. CARO-RG-8B-R24-01 TaxID=2914831 RepID=UPI001F59AEB6|nr:YuiA family protein [Sphingomonas sp. CARO-RG-8B-R24-01]